VTVEGHVAEHGSAPEDVADGIERAIARAQELGIAVRPGARFEVYVRRLREAAAARYPGPLPWKEPVKRMQFHEAIAQGPALARAMSVEPRVDPAAFRDRLQAALEGAIFPLPAAIGDSARNALFELTTAQAMHERGFELQFTSEDGLQASMRGLPTVAVECARVGDDRSWTEGMRRVAERLDRRADGRARMGMTVLGLDRLAGDSTRLRVFPDTGSLGSAVEATLAGAVRQAHGEARRLGEPFQSKASTGLIVLRTFVLLKDRGIFGEVAQMVPVRLRDGAEPAITTAIDQLAPRTGHRPT
jgi:hypothetical protein